MTNDGPPPGCECAGRIDVAGRGSHYQVGERRSKTFARLRRLIQGGRSRRLRRARGVRDLFTVRRRQVDGVYADSSVQPSCPRWWIAGV